MRSVIPEELTVADFQYLKWVLNVYLASSIHTPSSVDIQWLFFAAPYIFWLWFTLSSSVKVLAIVRTESTNNTKVEGLALEVSGFNAWLTAWETHPEEIHEKTIEPEVEKLWSGVNDFFVVIVKRVSGIIQNKSIHLLYGNNHHPRLHSKCKSWYEGSFRGSSRISTWFGFRFRGAAAGWGELEMGWDCSQLVWFTWLPPSKCYMYNAVDNTACRLYCDLYHTLCNSSLPVCRYDSLIWITVQSMYQSP